MKKIILLGIISLLANTIYAQSGEMMNLKEKNKINFVYFNDVYVLKYKLRKEEPKDSIINVLYNKDKDIISYNTIKIKIKNKENIITSEIVKSLGIRNTSEVDLLYKDDKIFVFPHIYKIEKADTFFKDNFVYIDVNERENYSFKYSSYQLGAMTIPIKWYVDSNLGNVETSLNAMFNIGRKWGTSHFLKLPHEEKIRQYKSAYSVNFLAGLSKISLNKSNTVTGSAIEGNVAAVSLGSAFGIHYRDFTFMLASGFDLPTANHSDWVFDGKPWIGIGFGVNFIKF